MIQQIFTPLIDREWNRLERNLQRSRKARCDATLSLSEWLRILVHYKWRCAFCGGPYDCMHHIIPISVGIGTEAGNVVPCCHDCNQKHNDIEQRGNVHRESIDEILGCCGPTPKIITE